MTRPPDAEPLPAGEGPPRISVVIPTYQRRDLVVATVEALARQEYAFGFEVVVVVDGSTDGSAAALRALRVPFPLTVLEQPNGGMPTARSAGGFAARGEILLFMDDDMEADPRLLAEHDRSHRGGAGIVLGPNPLHPASPPNLLSRWVRDWVDRRSAKLSAPGAAVPVKEIWGRYSVWRDSFLAVGGFDARLRRGSDVDFAHRVLLRGERAVFNALAISRQRYVVTPRQYLLQWRRSGQSDVTSARKQPEITSQILFPSWTRWPYRLLSRVPALTAPLRWMAIALVEREFQGALTNRVFFWAQALEYCRGLHEAGGMPRRRPLRILAYPAIQDRGGPEPRDPHAVPTAVFRQQVLSLLEAGYHFVSPHEVLHFVRGRGGLPRRPVLLMLGGCTSSVLEVLEEFRVPGLAFACTRGVEGSNEWDRQTGAQVTALLELTELRRLENSGLEAEAHGRKCPEPPGARATRFGHEGGSCRDDRRVLGLEPVRFLAFASGESNAAVRQPLETAGCQIAFGGEPDLVLPGADPFQLRRIEILPGDTGWRFRWKVAVAGPLLASGREWAWFARAVWGRGGKAMLLRAYRRLPSSARLAVGRMAGRRKESQLAAGTGDTR